MTARERVHEAARISAVLFLLVFVVSLVSALAVPPAGAQDAGETTTTTTTPTTTTTTTSSTTTTTTTSTTVVPTGPDDPRVGKQGIDTALPTTDSAVTASGRGRFQDLTLTVNQTENLTNQAVSVTWTGGTPTRGGGEAEFFDNFLQIMQCWGDDDGTVPENPGPPPEQCVWGATIASPRTVRSPVDPNARARYISSELWGEAFNDSVGVFAAPYMWRAFHAVDGTVIGEHINPRYNVRNPQGDFWFNTFFNLASTNEIEGARTAPDGSGAEFFQVLTGVESSGLGCGQRVLRTASGNEIPRCWLVVVPRGDAIDENQNAPESWRDGLTPIRTSPLAPHAWANRIAIELEFNPVDNDCSISDVERRLAGNELLVRAMSSWQTALCEVDGLPPYAYAPVPDASARQFVLNPVQGSPGLVAINRPIDPDLVAPDNPVVYAPLSVSGVTIGFNIERRPNAAGAEFPRMGALSGVRVAELNLTPRLVAKLLTQSYIGAVNIAFAGVPDEAGWISGAPRNLAYDPDFLRFNPEFELLALPDDRAMSGLQLPAGNSDAAQLVWEWVLADAEAKAWLDGQPDEWGMRVNPVYSTNPDVNPSGFPFADPTADVFPSSFPKADPYCYQAPDQPNFVPPALCGTDWLPYARSFDEAALRIRKGSDDAKVDQNPFPFDALSYWQRANPQPIGQRQMLAITDTASAQLAGAQMARLSRAGDDRAPGEREFVPADSPSMQQAVAAMEPSDEPQVLVPALDPPPGSYPLTVVTYGAIAPLALDERSRSEYAEFIAYAATDGQQPGLELGLLPRGYAPLPAALQEQSVVAAIVVLTLEPAPTTTTTSTTTSTTTNPPATIPPGSSNPVFNPPPFVPAPSGGGGAPSGSPGTSTPAATTTTAPVDAPATSEAPPTSEEPPATTEPQSDGSVPVDGGAAPASTDPLTTPGVDIGISRMAVPTLAGLLALCSLIAMEITKRPRRARS